MINPINKITKKTEVDEILKAISEADKEIHFIDTLTGMPYGYKEYFKGYFNRMKDFKKYTYSSQSIMIDEMNGWIDLINNEIKLFYEPDVEVEFIIGRLTGQRAIFKESFARDSIEYGFCKEVVK